MNSFNRRILLVALGTTPHLMTMTLSLSSRTYSMHTGYSTPAAL